MKTGLNGLCVESTQEYEVELLDRMAELSEAGLLDTCGRPDESGY